MRSKSTGFLVPAAVVLDELGVLLAMKAVSWQNVARSKVKWKAASRTEWATSKS